MALYRNRAWDSVFGGGTYVRWDTATPDSTGVSYPHTWANATGYVVERVIATGGATDHGALTGLVDDDHVGYARLVGRVTGQTLIGGTAAAENLTLRGTSHATPGTIIMVNPVVMGANNITGVGTLTGAAVTLTGTGTAARFVASTAGTTAGSFTQTTGESQSIVSLVNSGTSPASTNIYVATLAPGGAVSAATGALYVHVNGTSSTLYVNTSAVTGTTWTNLADTGSGTPGGASTHVQFNNAGAFAGSVNLVWTGTQLTVVGSVAATQGLFSTASAVPGLTVSSGVANTAALASFTSTGALGAATNLYVGTAVPTAVSATTGSLSVRVNGTGSSLYINTSAATGTDWKRVSTQYTVTLTLVAATAAFGDVLVCNSGMLGDAYTVTLPAVTAADVGRDLFVKLLGNNPAVTLDGDGTQTIDGVPTYLLSVANGAAHLVAVAYPGPLYGWLIVGGF